MSIKINSTNRGPAKKLLTFCGLDSKEVRTMSIAQLTEALQRCLNTGLITDAQVRQHLTPKSDWKNDASEQRSQREHEQHEDSDDEEVKDEADDSSQDGSQGDSSDQRDGDSESEEGESDSDNESENESESKDENENESEGDNESEDESDEEGEEDSDADSESDSDEEGESEDEKEKEGEQEGEDESESDGSEEGESDEQDEQEEDSDEELKHEVFARVLKYIRAGLNVALVGPAGTGKSYISRQVAAETGRDFYVNGAMMSKYDLIGYNDAHGTYHSTPAHDAFAHGGLHCFDEMDASSPDAVVSFNGMTDDQPFYTFPCGQVEQHDDYVAIACMNTWGNGASADYVGRFKQDAASMTRFVKVFVDYDERVEAKIAGKATDILERVRALRASCDELGIRHIVSTRMIVQAKAAREIGKATKAEIDADILFAGLDDAAIKQLKAAVNAKVRAAKVTS